MTNFDREYSEVDFNAPIVTGSDITVREYLDMSDEKRKEILTALEANASPKMKEFIANEKKFVTRSKENLGVLLDKIDK